MKAYEWDEEKPVKKKTKLKPVERVNDKALVDYLEELDEDLEELPVLWDDD